MRFDKQLAIECAQTIHALYRGELSPTINERSTDTQVLIQWTGNRALVVFPGTASFRDGLTDVRAAKATWTSDTRAHAGFVAAFRSVDEQLRERLIDQRTPDELIITGHSLGGALATLAAHAWSGTFILHPNAVYTFGSPRVGNGPFQRSYDAALHDATFRVVNEGDPVPRVPWMLGTYRHVGTRVFLGKAGEMEINPPIWRGLLPDPVELNAHKFVSIAPHHITEYVRRLQTA